MSLIHPGEFHNKPNMDSKLLTTQIALLLLAAAGMVASSNDLTTRPTPPNAIEVIKARGFLAEMYTIQSNGYPLTLYRIINPLANPETLNKYPVLYGHGILYDSMSMISRSEKSRPRKPVLGKAMINYGSMQDDSNDHSLPFMFSNNNFDVWLFDAKGTNNLNRNLSVDLDPSHAQKFWDFSLDEEALIDIPLLIDFVLTKTASTKLVYVGYSESTFFMFALLSTAPEYAEKISAFISLAPVAYVSHLRGLTIPLLAPMAGLTPEFIHNSFMPQPVIESVDNSLRSLCSVKGLSNIICGAIINGIGGKGVGEMTPNFFAEFFKSTSLKAVKHFLQLYVGRRFGMYDYGLTENLRRYGQPNPPAYDLSKVKSDRMILVRGLADFLSTPEDQGRLIKELGTKPFLDLVIAQYNHFDFIDGKDLINLVNGPVMLAVYELLYKDGQDVLRNQAQNQAISVAASSKFGIEIQNTDLNQEAAVAVASVASAIPGPDIAISRLLMNRDNKGSYSSDLLKNSAHIIQTLTGAKDVFRGLRTFVG